jgi:hypothetical protein
MRGITRSKAAILWVAFFLLAVVSTTESQTYINIATNVRGILKRANGGLGVSSASVPAHNFYGNNAGSSAAGGFFRLVCGDLSDSGAGCTLTTPESTANKDQPNGYAGLNGSSLLTKGTTGNAATATALASTPTSCLAGQVAQGIIANGNATGCTNAGVGFGSNVVVAGVLGGGNLQMDTCTVTSGSPNISCPSAQWDSTMAGFLIRANTQSSGNAFAVGTTVSSVTDATHAVASANASYTASGTASIGLYPRDETSTINSAITTAFSVENCGTVVVPRGIYLITSAFSALTGGIPAGCTNWGNGAGPFFQMVGFPESVQGKATSLTIPADFDWTTCTSSSTCFPNLRGGSFNFNGQNFQSLPAGAQNKTLVSGSMQNFGVHHLGVPSITGFESFKISGGGSGCRRCFFDSTGPVDWQGFFGTFSGYIEGSSYIRVGAGGNLQISSDGTQINGIEFYGSGGNVYCSQGAVLAVNSSIGGTSTVTKSTVNGGATLWIDGCQLSTAGGTNTFFATGGNNTTVHATHLTQTGTPTNYMQGDVRFFDECGNGAPLGGVGSWTGTYNGDCSITGTALVTGNIALTSGWDTSTKSAISGSSKRGQFTVNLAGAPASPGVITITFPVAFRFTAPICRMDLVGGTSSTIPTQITTGSVSTTSAAFNVVFSGTPTGTMIFQYACQVP